MGKRLDLLKEAFPKITTVVICGTPKLANLQCRFSKEQKRAPRLLDYNSGRVRSEAHEISIVPRKS